MTTVATSSPAAVDNGVNGGGQQPSPLLKEASMTTTAPMTTTSAARAGAATTLIGIPVAAIATGVLAGAARTLLELDRQFAGVDPGTVAVTTLIALAVGSALAATLRRLGRPHLVRPALLGGATLSLIGPATVLSTGPPDGPAHSNPQTALVLVCLHALAALAALRLTNSLPTRQQAHR
jgi:hypothetical protein